MLDALPNTEIIVTAERAPEQAQDTAASVSVIDGESIVVSSPVVTKPVAVRFNGQGGEGRLGSDRQGVGSHGAESYTGEFTFPDSASRLSQNYTV